MKKALPLVSLLLLLITVGTACKKDKPGTDQPGTQNVEVTGTVTDAKGAPLAGVKVVLEHTVWAGTYVLATTDATGQYKATLPNEPAGSWTAKAQVKRTAYGQEYTFDLAVDNTDPFTRGQATTRNFTWKLSGPRPNGTGFYGAHVDVYQWGTDVPMTGVKLVFSPFDAESRLADGTAIVPFERMVEDVAGTYMVKDVPVGKYKVTAVYPGKTLLLKNRHLEEQPEISKLVVFGKSGYLAETEYNIEFWVSE